jgi:hypothetical protein
LFVAFGNRIIRIHCYSDRSSRLTTNAGEKDSFCFAHRQSSYSLLRIAYFDGEAAGGCLTTICNRNAQAKRITL